MTNSDRKDDDETSIYKDLVSVVKENLAMLKGQKPGDRDMKDLYLLTRTYAVLKKDLRDDLSNEDLKNFRKPKDDSEE